MKTLLETIYPDLLVFPEAERPDVLRRARRAPLASSELAGIALALVVVTALTRYGSSGLDADERVAYALASFVIALPMLVIAVGPLLVRRTRRALRAEAARRGLPSRLLRA
jgi:hypothetical protein